MKSITKKMIIYNIEMKDISKKLIKTCMQMLEI